MTETAEKATLKIVVPRPDEKREKQRLKALEQGQVRAAEVEAKVREAMKTIEAEMKANDGIYPHKGGKISEAEVYRRAGVHPTTVPKNLAVYRELDKAVKRWKAALHEEKKPTGREAVRLTLAERVKSWRERHDDLEQVHAATEMQLQLTDAKLAEALKKVEKLEQENKQLRDILEASHASKVTPFPRRH